ncbi:hypothetical protein HJ526_11575 [Donghicola sp. C2-DW-16]|uniref:HPt domain-containing protein n=1 Tax=Donghicola mangrovi TaxID=2729614 RepID=A0ABX2PG67_9RHOB|nr:hypothetical protein [Donghicola mangrovi]NVO28064.1 hypothetical protein [Donghicola mangrovi]
MDDLDSLHDRNPSDPDLEDLFPMALARMVMDVHMIEQLVADGDMEQAKFLAYKLHGIATLFQISDFSAMLTRIIEHMERDSDLTPALLAEMASQARARLDGLA